MMTYFKNALTPEELKSMYRRLALIYHPDKGGNKNKMQSVNNEYSSLIKEFHKIPRSLEQVRVGNLIYVNKSKCIVTEVDNIKFKAKSLDSKREAYFSKSTGFAMLNFRYRASLSMN